VNFLLVMNAFTACCVCCRFSRFFPLQTAVLPSVYHLKLKYYNVWNCNLVIVLYGCQNYSPTLREEHSLRFSRMVGRSVCRSVCQSVCCSVDGWDGGGGGVVGWSVSWSVRWSVGLDSAVAFTWPNKSRRSCNVRIKMLEEFKQGRSCIALFKILNCIYAISDYVFVSSLQA